MLDKQFDFVVLVVVLIIVFPGGPRGPAMVTPMIGMTTFHALLGDFFRFQFVMEFRPHFFMILGPFWVPKWLPKSTSGALGRKKADLRF